ncbi:MAG: phosphotransferase [Xanthomonadales bacterium]|nr:N-acetylmuramate/N-acetylglucosamine kinase [Xanthomonadales bacterium]MCC6593745.1 phosphotransferase [Xanthomonadales bacterium]MCE7931619.1 aminoglycoside phosphotransferase [Xanthomonadales bacterium PRO6]
MTPDRLSALAAFSESHLGPLDAAPVAASADASFRSYWRVFHRGESRIVMNAPPDKEDVGPFIDIAGRLRAAGLNAPHVLAQDRVQGFLLLSDLGTRTFLPELNEATVESLYGDAFDALLAMQTRVDVAGLPVYDAQRLTTEMELFESWFLRRHLGFDAGCDETDAIEGVVQTSLNSAAEQPVAFVHRDYHSRNLMIVTGANPGIVDFQDAVIGPLTYDLVSLLKDCYIRWPLARVHGWAESYRQRAVAAGLVQVGATRWRRWFDWMGLQRHLKVLGIFARLWYRDGKAGYLNDLPLVLGYTLEVCARYDELAPFGQWLERLTRDRDLTRPRH